LAFSFADRTKNRISKIKLQNIPVVVFEEPKREVPGAENDVVPGLLAKFEPKEPV